MRRTLITSWLLIACVLLGGVAHADDKAEHDPPAQAKDDDGDSDPKKGDAPKEKEPEKSGPVKMKVGVRLTSLSKLDLAADSFNAEMIVTVHCDKAPCNPAFEVNGKLTATDKVKDEPLMKVLKLRAELEAAIDTSQFPYDDHLLPIVLMDKANPEGIVYERDDEHTSVDEKVKLPGWELTGGGAEVLAIEDGNGGSLSQYWFAVRASRPRLQATIKTVLPLCVMLFVAAFMLLLKPKSAAGRLAAATGGLMSIVMFHVGQSSGLPPGELTRFDKVMMATYVVYLINIAFAVAIVRSEERKTELRSELLYLAAAGTVPGVAILGWTLVLFRFV